jgi:hypothetical protein
MTSLKRPPALLDELEHGEDATAEGSTRARQNVVHEVGLFQGCLGFSSGVTQNRPVGVT